MKKLMSAIVCIVAGTCLLLVSMLTKNASIEKWSSFLLGLSFPFYIGGIISLVKYFRQQKPAAPGN